MTSVTRLCLGLAHTLAAQGRAQGLGVAGGSMGGSAHVGSAKQSLDLCELCESLSASNRALFHCFNCLHRHAGGSRDASLPSPRTVQTD